MKLRSCNKVFLEQVDDIDEVEEYDEDRCFPYKQSALTCRDIPLPTGLQSINLKTFKQITPRSARTVPTGKKCINISYTLTG